MSDLTDNLYGTAAEWTDEDPTLASGIIGFETDTRKYKVGDGSSIWSNIDYAAGRVAWGSEQFAVMMAANRARQAEKEASGGFLPGGGATGTILAKNSAADYDASFTALGTVPSSGSAFQVLQKASATNYDTSWVSVPLIVCFNGANVFQMADATNAERFAAGSTRHIMKLDLARYSEARATTRIVVNSGSANTPKIRWKYYTSFSTTVGDYLQLGASAQLELSVASATYVDTGWIAMAAGAKADGVYIATTELGGDGAADPSIGNTYLWFR